MERARNHQPHRIIGRAAAALLWPVLWGCGGSAIPADTVLEYDRCRGLQSGVSVVDMAAVAGIRGTTLVSPRGDAAQNGTQPLLIAVSRGRQPTPGYRLTLEGARRNDDTVLVTVGWHTPESGSVQPERITHPCLVVALSRTGLAQPPALSRLEVRDQHGARLGTLNL